MDKPMINFAKQKSKPPMAAAALAAKKKAAPPAPAKPSKEPPGEEEEGDNPGHGGKEPFELVGEAAEAAEKGGDTVLEDAVAGEAPAADGTPPAWATDAEKWQQAAQAVGLGQEGAEDTFEEPGVVAAYLYKMLGGEVRGAEEEASAGGAGGGDMEAPGAAAVAVKAKRGLTGAEGSAGEPGEVGGSPGGEEDAAAVAEGVKQALESPDPDIQRLTADYDPERDGNPPAWVADEATWARAKEAVDPEGEGARYDEPWAVTTHVYKKMKGRFK